jgi:hypothetical protein
MDNRLDTKSAEFSALWDSGFRPYEIYVFNDVPVDYFGIIEPAGSVPGWDIKHVFAKKTDLDTYPFFDCVICGSSMADVTEIHSKGETQ